MKQRRIRPTSTLVALAIMDQTPFARALARQDFDTAARFLLVGFARTLDRLPAGSLEGLLDVINGREYAPKARKKNTL